MLINDDDNAEPAEKASGSDIQKKGVVSSSRMVNNNEKKWQEDGWVEKGSTQQQVAGTI